MLDNILGVVKNIAMDALDGNADVPSDKKDQVVSVVAESVTNGLASNIGGLASLFTGGSGSNSIMDSIQSTVVSSLAQKVGLSPAIANGLASTVLPIIMKSLSGKVQSGESGLSLEGIVGALSGGSASKGNGGGILGMISGIFGK